MRAFHFYIDDWLSSKHIRRMDANEERGYLRLLLHAASEPDCGLPDDDQELADISLLGHQWFEPTSDPGKRFRDQTSGSKLRACFFLMRDGTPVNSVSGEAEPIDERVSVSGILPGRLYNQRLLREFQYQQLAAAQRSEAGKASGESRRRAKNERAFNERSNEKRTDVQREPQRKTNNDVCVCVSVDSSNNSSVVSKTEELPDKGRVHTHTADACVTEPSIPESQTESPSRVVAIRKPQHVEEVPICMPAAVNGDPWFPVSPPRREPDPALDVWLEGEYAVHPKKSEKFQALTLMVERFRYDESKRRCFTDNHAKWIEYWRCEQTPLRYIPNLKNFLSDDTWLYEPPAAVEEQAGLTVEVPEL